MKRRALVMVAALALAGGACGGDDDSGAGDWCDLARDLESNTVFDDIDVSDPDSVERSYREIIGILQDAADSAPDEIEADVETMLTDAEDLLEVLEDADFDFRAVDESALGDLETADASDRIEEYGERVCGVVSDENSEGTIGGGSDDGTIGDIDDIAIRDQLIAQFEALGMTEDQASCLIDNMDLEDVAAAGNQLDPSMFLHLFSTCGIDFDSQSGD